MTDILLYIIAGCLAFFGLVGAGYTILAVWDDLKLWKRNRERDRKIDKFYPK